LRADGKDVVEQFGMAPDDLSDSSTVLWEKKQCPFTLTKCTKFNHDKSKIYGVCSVTNGNRKGAGSEVIICPKRLYANSCSTLNDAAKVAWPSIDYKFIVKGDLSSLLNLAKQNLSSVIAYGQGSGKELSTNSANGKMSMDWVLQRYTLKNGNLDPIDFIGIEVQSIDITNNYRDPLIAYEQLKEGLKPDVIPNSSHGLNWANVHKRLIPQIIRKGNIYKEMERCVGFFFLLPEIVFSKFEEVLGNLEEKKQCSKENLTILTYRLGDFVEHGKTRELVQVRAVHYSLDDISDAFSSSSGKEPAKNLNARLLDLK